MSTNSGSPLQVFEPFPKLPPEIRIKIWRLSLPRIRVIKLTSQQIVTNSERSYHLLFRCTKQAVVPLIWEARSVALEFYSLQDVQLFGGQRVYFNFDIDIFVSSAARGSRPFWGNQKTNRTEDVDEVQREFAGQVQRSNRNYGSCDVETVQYVVCRPKERMRQYWSRWFAKLILRQLKRFYEYFPSEGEMKHRDLGDSVVDADLIKKNTIDADDMEFVRSEIKLLRGS